MVFAWKILLITVAFAVVVQSSKLYCISHGNSRLNVEKCTTSKNRQVSAAALTNNSVTTTVQNNLTFDLICKSDPLTCEGVSTTFSKATEIISSVFQFETPLLINASFVDFCQEYGDCTNDKRLVYIGKAHPSISYVMVDTSDNMTRMYPQPLLKQFTDLKIRPAWTLYDINAQFNSQVNWRFANNANPINSNQTDFLRNVLHELIHGLGFMVSWSDELYKGLSPLFQQDLDPFITPELLALTANEQLLNEYNSPLPFWGFVEYPLDKYLGYKESGNFHSYTSITSQLNQFYDSNVLFRNIVDMANSWYESSSYNIAKQVYARSVSQQDVLAVIQGEVVVTLESSVKPFLSGASLCHVDQSSYLNSSDYLMVYTANRGVGIVELDQLFPDGPFGPKLKRVMGALGYNIKAVKTIRPTLRYWSPPNGLVDSNSNPNPSLTININGPAKTPTVSSSTSNSPVSTSSASFTTIYPHNHFLRYTIHLVLLTSLLLSL
ncbi:uncharacterized protein EV154DRAFT_554781 [Mucor mucedo]|uniref:uncharacterized protein n=1 Tax=Mucor mucedo TaxID=29922 RepID=UPI0022205A0E|nr:uncharacterized protein EV154DRAFT_554781 [Mucor mucedo]KAI7885460.1 hypothetical protein EV154DRAFT_554781 [Mucor mucedo]